MQSIRCGTAALALTLLCAAPARAAEYYVSSSLGDDTRSASLAQDPATPWAPDLRAHAPRLHYLLDITCRTDQGGSSVK